MLNSDNNVSRESRHFTEHVTWVGTTEGSTHGYHSKMFTKFPGLKNRA